MIGVVIGTGEWNDVARVAANRMSEMTDIPVVTILGPADRFVHPSWLKCTLLDLPELSDHDSFLVFDADVICCRKWDPDGLFETLGRPFCAIPDLDTDAVYDECVDLGIPFPGYYVNAGLVMFGREHREVWDFVRRKHPRCGRWLEQGALNLALMHTGVEMCRLPRQYNTVTYRGMMYYDGQMKDKAINLHLTSMSGPKDLGQMQELYGLSIPSEQVGSSGLIAEAGHNS